MDKGAKVVELNSMQIQEIIPHRYPFLLVDKIVELIPGKSAVGIKSTTATEYFYQGHFPDYPVMPGVLIIEALAQVGAVIVLSVEENKGKKVLFGGIKNARFKQQVTPGDVLSLECVIVETRGPIGYGKAVARLNGKVATQCDLSFVVVD